MILRSQIPTFVDLLVFDFFIMARQAKSYPKGKFILRALRQSKTGRSNAVYLYYYWQKRQIRKAMDLFVDGKDWNPNAENNTGGFRPSYGQEYVKYNTYLQKFLREVDNKIVSYIDMHGDISPETILDIIDGNDKVLRQDQGIEFLDFAKQRFVDRYNSGLIGVSSRENGISYINQFARFLMSEHRGSHGPKNELLYISEITERIVLDFRNWFLGCNRKVDTVNKVIQAIGSICDYAAHLHYLSLEVAMNIRNLHLTDRSLDAEEVSVKYLTEEQLQKFADLRDSLQIVRQREFHDMFMFSFYACGLRLIDMMTLRWKDIDFEKKIIRKVQVKTRNRNVIPIREPAFDILERWKSRYRVFVFGLLSDQFDLNDDEALRKRRNSITATINTSLKRQSKLAGLDREITFHFARHTWAVLALKRGVEISVISRLLGHTSTAITEKVYAEFLPDTLGEVVDGLDFKF